ncbi:MAG: cation diffusion facilitator family transporter [Methylophilaceae bacterium]
MIELIGGIWTNSLALIGDAGHMATDMLALALAMFAEHRAQKTAQQKVASKQMSIEVIVSIVNALLMLIVLAWLVFEALERLENPPTIAGGYVAVVALLGLVVNIIVARQLHQQSHIHSAAQQLNHRAAFLHVMGDLLGSATALLAGLVVYFTGWQKADPLLSLFIAALILWVTLGLIRDITRTVFKGNHHH